MRLTAQSRSVLHKPVLSPQHILSSCSVVSVPTLSPLLSCLGQLSPPLDSRSSPRLSREPVHLSRSVKSQGSLKSLPDLAALAQMHATDQAGSSVQSEIHICKVLGTILSKILLSPNTVPRVPLSLGFACEVQWLQKGW